MLRFVINLILGLIFSFGFGIVTIKILLEMANTIKFWGFCVIIGLLALLPLIIFLLSVCLDGLKTDPPIF